MIAGKLAKTDLDNGRIDLDPIAGATLGGCGYPSFFEIVPQIAPQELN